MLGILGHASIPALLSLIVAVLPMAMEIVYVIRPNEAHVALMRPQSLASLFAGPAGTLSGWVNIARALGAAPASFQPVGLGFSESLVPLFVACGCLTIGRLCVAFGLGRST